MFGLTLESATSIAAVLAVVFVVLAIASLWIMHSIVQKLISVAVMGVLAFAMWTQRAALEDCADKVAATFALIDEAQPTLETAVDNQCSIFGITVTVPNPGDDG